MPWEESVIMDERMKFIGRLLQGDKMAELAREFGISRKTGYKFWGRFPKRPNTQDSLARCAQNPGLLTIPPQSDELVLCLDQSCVENIDQFET